jgi:4-amino-4-deoxy-L-arabinose transferase-like glycosyltransferase
MPPGDELTRSRPRAWLVVLGVWAGIYLPALGRQELRGEEGRRVLPAVRMIETGDWLVPHVGGEPYLAKPPGVNWLVAASFLTTGVRNETTARLPSVLFILLFVTAVVWTQSPWLSLRGRLIAALVFLTIGTVMEKGRQIEIEAAYVCLGGLAVLAWLNAWGRRASGSRLWLLPGALLGLGMLVKGPFLLVPYYAVVVLVLVYSRRLREALGLWHALSVVLIVGPFVAWAAAAFPDAGAEGARQVWIHQLWLRLNPAVAKLPKWAANVGHSFVFVLPWAVLMPRVWLPRVTAGLPDERRALFRGARAALAVAFLVLVLPPNVEPRYSMVVYPLAALLLGGALACREQLTPERWWRGALLLAAVLLAGGAVVCLVCVSRGPAAWLAAAAALTVAIAYAAGGNSLRGPARLTLATAGLAVVFAAVYAAHATWFMDAQAIRRPAAGMVDAAVDGETVYAYRVRYQSFLFYVESPIVHVFAPQEVAPDVRFLLVRQDAIRPDKADLGLPGLAARAPRVVAMFSPRMPDRCLLLRLNAPDRR